MGFFGNDMLNSPVFKAAVNQLGVVGVDPTAMPGTNMPAPSFSVTDPRITTGKTQNQGGYG